MINTNFDLSKLDSSLVSALADVCRPWRQALPDVIPALVRALDREAERRRSGAAAPAVLELPRPNRLQAKNAAELFTRLAAGCKELGRSKEIQRLFGPDLVLSYLNLGEFFHAIADALTAGAGAPN